MREMPAEHPMSKSAPFLSYSRDAPTILNAVKRYFTHTGPDSLCEQLSDKLWESGSACTLGYLPSSATLRPFLRKMAQYSNELGWASCIFSIWRDLSYRHLRALTRWTFT